MCDSSTHRDATEHIRALSTSVTIINDVNAVNVTVDSSSSSSSIHTTGCHRLATKLLLFITVLTLVILITKRPIDSDAPHGSNEMSFQSVLQMPLQPPIVNEQDRTTTSSASDIDVDLKIIERSTQRHGRSPFPPDFIWGTATSSYQVEGGVNEGHRGLSIWDTFCNNDHDNQHIVDGSNGDVTCDHYHRFRDDVLLLKRLNIKAYRFSIAWTRIYPNGRPVAENDGDGGPNPDGISFYNELIDELLLHGIEPWVTLYHWDLPQELQDEYGGWLDPRIVDDFGRYAAACFNAFGDRVKYWITLNESWTVAVQAYEDGTKAPGMTDNPPVNVYRAGHHLLLAHARAVSIYRSRMIPDHKSNGQIGIANCGDFRYPKNSQSLQDQDAAERAMVFQFGWLTDPLVFGDYPQEMKDRVGDRLPTFTTEQQNELIGSLDFVGLNHYSSLYAAAKQPFRTNQPLEYGGYWNDMSVDFSTDPSWRKNYMGWSTNADGCRELLIWISKRYPGLQIAMTENGTSENEPSLDTAIHDEGRRQYFESYLRACGEAIGLGTPLIAYFAWSLMDNFEWEYGYTRRFGICYVDFETLERTPKSSALWYRDTIRLNGSNLLIS